MSVYPWEIEPEGECKSEAPSWLIENIAELSKSARTLYIIYIGFLIYCALTILTTTDRKIVLDEKAHLPIINLDVPLSVFVVAGPLVAIFVFLYFQLYLHALKETIQRLHAEFAPTGVRRLYPWMINLVEEAEPGFLGMIQRAIIKISLWLLLPLTLILFTFFTLRKHDSVLSFYEWAMLVTGTVLVIWLRYRYEQIPAAFKPAFPTTFSLRGRQPKPLVRYIRKITWSNVGKWLTALVTYWRKIIPTTVLFLFYVFLLLMTREENMVKTGLFSVNLSNEQLAEKKQESAYWVDLHGIHLEGANMSYTFLRHANLENAYLKKAKLHRADLKNADMLHADLSEAVLTEAKLTDAILSDAVLREANLSEADLSEADLSGADLSGGNLNCANLHKAILRDANLKDALLIGADLRGSESMRGLEVEQFSEPLSKVKSLFNAKLDPSVEGQLREKRPELFNVIMSQEQLVDKFIEEYEPGKDVAVSIRSDSKELLALFNEYRSQAKRMPKLELLIDLSEPSPAFILNANASQEKLIIDYVPEWRYAFETENPFIKGKDISISHNVIFVSDKMPVLVTDHRSTYYLEEVVILTESVGTAFPRTESPFTLSVIVRATPKILAPVCYN
jgi:hypothetical protein